MAENYGVINEIGDLGLGFDPLNESDSEKLKKEQEEKEFEKETKDKNENEDDKNLKEQTDG